LRGSCVSFCRSASPSSWPTKLARRRGRRPWQVDVAAGADAVPPVWAAEEEGELAGLELAADLRDRLAVRPAVVVRRLADKVDAEGLVCAAERARVQQRELLLQLRKQRVRPVGALLGERSQAVEEDLRRVRVLGRGGDEALEQRLLDLKEDYPAQEAEPAAERVRLVLARGVHEGGEVREERIEPLDEDKARATRLGRRRLQRSPVGGRGRAVVGEGGEQRRPKSEGGARPVGAAAAAAATAAAAAAAAIIGRRLRPAQQSTALMWVRRA